jgi:hypothetical protein
MGYVEKSSEEVRITWDPQRERQLHVFPRHHPRCCLDTVHPRYEKAKKTALFHCKIAKDHDDAVAVAVAAAGDNGWMVLLTVRDRCCLGEESLVARVVSHVAARRWRRYKRRDFVDVIVGGGVDSGCMEPQAAWG